MADEWLNNYAQSELGQEHSRQSDKGKQINPSRKQVIVISRNKPSHRRSIQSIFQRRGVIIGIICALVVAVYFSIGLINDNSATTLLKDNQKSPFAANRFDGLGQLSSPYPPSPIPSEEEFAKIRTTAENGDAESQLYMGYFFANGDRIKQDFAMAANWYRKAAEQGNARAQYYLGFLYDCGVGVEQDFGEAFKWYMKAVEQNDPAAHLGIAGFHFAYRKSYMPLYFGNYDVWRAKAIYMSRAKPNAPSLEESLWNQYNSGNKFYQNDYEIAKAVNIRAKSGDGGATLYLAQIFFHAQGVSRNPEVGNMLVNIAEQQGEYSAAFILGATSDHNGLVKVSRISDLERGAVGIPSAIEQRLMYLSKAAQSARESYFTYYYHSWLLPGFYSRNPSNEQVIASQGAIQGLAEKGFIPAQYKFGCTLIDDLKNSPDGIAWLRKAAVNGMFEAMAEVGIMYLYGDEAQGDLEEGKKWLDKAIQYENLEILIPLCIRMRKNHKLTPEKTNKIMAWLRDRSNNGDANSYFYHGLFMEECIRNRQAAGTLYLEALARSVHIAAFRVLRMTRSEDLDAAVVLDRIDIDEPEYLNIMRCGIQERGVEFIVHLPGALKNYGPTLIATTMKLKLLQYNQVCNPIFHDFMRKCMSNDGWYNYQGEGGNTLPFLVIKYYEYLDRDKYNNIKTTNDGISMLYGEQ